MDHNYLIVIPCYRNDATVGTIVRAANATGYMTLVVDDGNDRPLSATIQYDPTKTMFVRHEINRGKGSAIQSALKIARQYGYTHIVTIDADGQHEVSDAASLIRLSQANPAAIVIGDRNFDRPDNFVPGSSRFGRNFSNFWIWVETGLRYKDTQSGYRVYPVNAILNLGLSHQHYDFEVEVLTKANWSHIKILSTPIAVHYPSDRISSFKKFRDNARLTGLHTKLVCLSLWYRLFQQKNFAKEQAPKELRGAYWTRFLLRFAGASFSYFICPAVAMVYWIFMPKQRDSINALLFYSGTSRPGFWTSYRNCRLFALSILDRITYATFGRVPQIRYIAKNKIPENRPFTAMTAHYGDWTFLGVAFALEFQRPAGIVLHKARNPKITSLVEKAAPGLIRFCDPREGTLNLILQCRDVQRQNGIVCLMADRLVQIENDQIAHADFLGQKIPYNASIFKLALLLKQPAYLFASCRTGLTSHAAYDIDGDLLWDGQECLHEFELARRYFMKLESIVRRSPEHWFNFHDFFAGAPS
jgi:predicted LPLAT superfamily acyltransferase